MRSGASAPARQPGRRSGGSAPAPAAVEQGSAAHEISTPTVSYAQMYGAEYESEISDELDAYTSLGKHTSEPGVYLASE